MKSWQKALLSSVYVLSGILTFGIPLMSLANDLIIGQEERVVWSISTAFTLGVLGFTTVKLVSRKINRRLQSIDVADELGVVGQTPVMMRWALLVCEILIPIVSVSLVLYGLEQIDLPSYRIFLDLLWSVVPGLTGYLAHGLLRKHYMQMAIIDKELNLQQNVDKLRQKRAKKVVGRY